MSLNNYTHPKFENENLNFIREFEKYLVHWKWFLLGVVVAFIIARIYLRYATPSYNATASILIKDNKKSGISAEFAAFEDLGIVGGSANNTDNEIEILKSRRIIGHVVDTLKLNHIYIISGRVTDSQVYKERNPIVLNLKEKSLLNKEIDTSFVVSPYEPEGFHLLDYQGNPSSTHKYGELITSSIGTFTIDKNIEYKGNREENDVRVVLKPRYRIIDYYRNLINISVANKNSSMLILSLDDVVREKAVDILDQLIKQYNIDAIQDKNQVSKKTKQFIDGRLKKVQSDLYLIDKNVKDFKSDQDFTGLPIEAQLAFQSLKETTTRITEAKVSLAWAEEIEKTLTEESSKYETLPSALGFNNNITVSNGINKYNDLILQINKLKVNSGAKNPILVQLETQKKSLQSSLLGSLANISKSLELQLRGLNREEEKVLDKVRSFPANEQGFIDMSRQQEIVSGLYQYLLKKKEETDISLAVTVPNAKIIDSGYSPKNPVSPKRNIIYLASLLFGLLIPFIIIYLYDLLDTKVHNKDDIKSELSIPFLGNIPKSESKEKIVIDKDLRSGTAEAFRLIRTNLDFMSSDKIKGSKSIFVTSTISGEGKSFIAINLASALTLAGKKVLLVGMDLRVPKIIEYLNVPDRKGVTNYITDDEITLEELIFTAPKLKGVDIIASGTIPPNPSELLMTKRVESLFTIAKQKYDIIIIDTAPVDLVSDTLLISKYADLFIYVIRANYLDKRLLPIAQTLYNEKRLPNMAVVLNDTSQREYGYGGYRGGYGYNYRVVEKPWYKKFFHKKD